MNILISAPRARVVGLAVACAAVACTEPRPIEQRAVPVTKLEAVLEVSDSLPRTGTELRVGIRAGGERWPKHHVPERGPAG